MKISKVSIKKKLKTEVRKFGYSNGMGEVYGVTTASVAKGGISS